MATSSPRNSLGNVRYDMDISYPEHLSLLNRHIAVEISKNPSRMKRNTRSRTRYRTQPVTFDEIQEVDEETTIESPEDLSASVSQLQLDGFKFPNVLGSKRKKSKAEKATGETNKYINTNGETAIQQKAVDQVRRTERSRDSI